MTTTDRHPIGRPIGWSPKPPTTPYLYRVAPDGEDEMTVWRLDGIDDQWPLAMVRKSDVRDAWPLLLIGVLTTDPDALDGLPGGGS